METRQGTEENPLQLEYGRAAPLFHRRWFVRALIYSSIIIGVIALRKPSSRFIASWNLNRLVAASVDRSDPPGTVIYSAKVDANTGWLIAQSTRRIQSWDTAQASQYFAGTPLRHHSAATLFVGKAPPQFAHNAEVFGIDLQFNHNTGNNRRGVVQGEIRAARRNDAGQWMIGQFCTFPLLHMDGDWSDISIEAASIDPSDPRHLTFDMVVDGTRDTFDVYLQGNSPPTFSPRNRDSGFHYLDRQ